MLIDLNSGQVSSSSLYGALFNCDNNTIPIIKLLIKHGADLNSQNSAFGIPFQYFLLFYNVSKESILFQLLELGADWKQVNIDQCNLWNDADKESFYHCVSGRSVKSAIK
jgi:ankyrin repeat protein